MKVIKLGNTYLIKYNLCKKDEIKECYFSGLCVNKSTKELKLRNKVKKELLTFSAKINNPLINAITILKISQKKNKLKKINWNK